jgi:hypothetical protein
MCPVCRREALENWIGFLCHDSVDGGLEYHGRGFQPLFFSEIYKVQLFAKTDSQYAHTLTASHE